MFGYKKILAVCLIVICMTMLFGCGKENEDKTRESVSSTPSATETSKELVMPTDENGNVIEVITVPLTESAQDVTVDVEEASETATATATKEFEETQQVTEATEENEQETQQKTQKETVIELPFIPAD